ncbi:UNVERIFIED_CONTAM: hypothetical protein RMT77_012610 [Armadillidium vulgare]
MFLLELPKVLNESSLHGSLHELKIQPFSLSLTSSVLVALPGLAALLLYSSLFVVLPLFFFTRRSSWSCLSTSVLVALPGLVAHLLKSLLVVSNRLSSQKLFPAAFSYCLATPAVISRRTCTV